jgi:HSP20 family protein
MTIMERNQLPTLESIVDRLLSVPFGFDLPFAAATLPPLDVYEKDGKYIVEVAVPGYKPQDIAVEVNGCVLTIRGTYKVDEQKNLFKIHHKEIRRGSFQRTITLPQDLDPDKVQAVVTTGLLTLTLTPLTPIATKTIPVTGA